MTEPRPTPAQVAEEALKIPRPVKCPRCHGSKIERRDRQNQTCGMCGGRGYIITEHEDLEAKTAVIALMDDTDHLDQSEYLINRTLEAVRPVIAAAIAARDRNWEEELRARKPERLATMLYRSLERLSLAIESCARIGFTESSPTQSEFDKCVWDGLNEAQADAKLKLQHYQQFVAVVKVNEDD